MFNSLASYILGNGNRNATDITQDGQQLSGASDEAINNFKFVTTSCEDEDEEWLLVEKGGKSFARIDCFFFQFGFSAIFL